MTQNTEQNVRTRDEQARAIANAIRAGYGNLGGLTHIMAKELTEAEARGAEEQRRKDAEGQEAIYQYQYSDQSWCDTSQEEYERNTALDPNDTRILYTRPANVATLKARIEAMTFSLAQSYGIRGEKQKRINEVEAEIASLKEAEQLARADAEASKARVEKLTSENLKFHDLVCRAQNNVPEFYEYWHSAARAALTRKGGV